jgi:general nucleoside transport system permease protein
MTGIFDAAWLAAAISLTTPVLFAALGETIAERTGIINVGLEGMMLSGAFFGFLVTWQTGSPWLGVLTGLVAGMVLAALMALLSIVAGADQIVCGIGLNILAFGITAFVFDQLFAHRGQVILDAMTPLGIPGLQSLGGVGRALFHQPPLAYIAYLLVPAIWFLLHRTSAGLALRAAGELPEAVDTAGISVRSVRWAGTLTAGALAGVGGAYLSVVSLGLFVQGMSAGRGFIALAAVIFGRWRPFGVLVACLVFGGADALQLRLQAQPSIPREVWIVVAALPALAFAYALVRRHVSRSDRAKIVLGATVTAAGTLLAVVRPAWSIPSQMWLTMPYIVAILVLAGVVGRTRLPAALGLPYRRAAETTHT